MTHSASQLSTQSAPRPNLRYPFEKGFSPAHGEPFEVADGVFWVRVPLPISLDHINLWLLRDGDGWVIVDSGYDDHSCRAVWDTVFDSFCSAQSVNKIIITHYHPDHIGLAAWLAHRCDCKVHITRGEFERYRKLVDRAGQSKSPEIKAFITELGFSPEQQALYNRFFSVDDKPSKDRVQHADCVFIADGDQFQIGDYEWRVVMGNGHSPEHACLYCPSLETLISGDQALPRISSNISVYFSNRHEDPLSDWLASCQRLRDQLPSNTLVLPSHQEPFFGLDLRMQQLIDDHVAQLNKLRIGLTKPTSAADSHKLLFERELSESEVLMATGETLAHINYLLHRGELTQTATNDGVKTYSLAQASSAA